jgi:FMN reductase
MTTSAVDVVELIGNQRTGSRTRALADAAVTALASRLSSTHTPLGDTTVLELADLVSVSFGPEPARATGAVVDPFATVRSAGLLVVATPAYKGTVTGLLKIFFDQFERDALAGMVALPVTVAASPLHLSAVSVALRDLLVELGARVPAASLAVRESRLTTQAQIAADWAERHGDAIAELLAVPRVPA